MSIISHMSNALECYENRAAKAIIITGAGNTAFSAGVDIKYLAKTPLKVPEFAELAVSVNNKIETLGKVVVAAINGYALYGGLEMAESCMSRVAVGDTKLGHPEVQIGAFAGLARYYEVSTFGWKKLCD